MYDLEFSRVYLNDLIFSASGLFEEHLAKVEEVMKWLQSDGLKYKIAKCKFAVPKVKYFVYVITREGIKPDPEKSKQFSIFNALRIKTR